MPSAGFAYARWEKFRFNPPPSRQELEALAVVVGVEGDRLLQMLPTARGGNENGTDSVVWGVLC
ncbi:MAG: hypothetical protein ACKPH7_26025 [Planktothrix sp.]|uniref:hypothetical protein n=1 Tax=Planktothrix sp. TaxID=3088171 RepID=UPI0038D35C69